MKEQGTAKIVLTLRDGTIRVRHGDDGTLLGIKTETRTGDWSKIVDALVDQGIIWLETR